MSRFHLRTSLGLALSLVLATTALASAAPASENRLPFDEALTQAKERDVPMVIDFFTDWCVYCKHFDAHLADPESGLRGALDAVVFTSIDAEKGDGVELAERFGVSGFPTYVVVNSDGELVDRWSGYGGPEHFLSSLKPALADPTTAAEKLARFEKNPTAKDAEKLAGFSAGDGEFARAIELYRKAEELDPSKDLSEDIVYTAYLQWREDDTVMGKDFVALVGESLSDDDVSDSWMLALSLAGRVSRAEESAELLRPVLAGALAAAEKQPDFDAQAKIRLRVMSLLHLENKGEEAAQLKKETMKEGWLDSSKSLNSYAWWCFENQVNLAEAEKLARHGIEVAESGPETAMILDTAAEICNARGNCRDAVTLIERAIAEDPDNSGYKKQLDRFQKILAAAE
jgi:thioredoxin-like negative regulator of GroEL